MCRLFARQLDQPVTSDLWLLDAPHSLLNQSRFHADRTSPTSHDESAENAA